MNTTTMNPYHFPEIYRFLSAAVFLGRRRHWYRSMLTAAGVQAGHSVLDLGSGPGVLTALAAEICGPTGGAVGVDSSSAMVRYASKQAAPNCRFFLDAAEDYRAAEATFNAVVSCLAFYDFPGGRRSAVLENVFAMLQPGGNVLIVELRPHTGHLGRGPGAIGVKANDIETIALLLAESGFDAVSAIGFGPLLHGVVATKPALSCVF